MMFKAFAFSCVLFTVCVSLSLSSPLVAEICQKPNLQRALCSSSYVLRAKVLLPGLDGSNKEVGELWAPGVYKLEIIQLFAFRPGGNNKVCVMWPYVYLEAPTSAFTGMSTSLGQSLDLDVEYLLTGSFDASKGKLSMGLCDWKKKWSEMSSAEKRKLTSGQCNQSKNVISFP